MRLAINRKNYKGIVISDKMEKTVVVKVFRLSRHKRYGKVIKIYNKFYAHDIYNTKVGEHVSIVETRPLSKTKCWRVVKGGVE